MGLALRNGHPIPQFWIVTTPWEMLAGTNHMLNILRCFMSLCLGIRRRFLKNILSSNDLKHGTDNGCQGKQ